MSTKICCAVILCCISIGLLGSCSARESEFILLPDPDGNVGEISVSNAGSAITLSKAGYGIHVRGNRAPDKPHPVDEKKFQAIFGKVLDVEPEPPKIYILFFETRTTELRADSLALIPDILSDIRSGNSRDISVVGHTDRQGERETNIRLSLQRALKVRDVLIAAGVDAAIITTTSHGEGNPLIKTGDNVAEPRNRRVEVIIR